MKLTNDKYKRSCRTLREEHDASLEKLKDWTARAIDSHLPDEARLRAWTNYTNTLRNLVTCTLTGQLGSWSVHEWSFDHDTRAFTFECCATLAIDAEDRYLRVSFMLAIDPRADLDAELARLAGEVRVHVAATERIRRVGSAGESGEVSS